ncbi:MAG: N-acetylmuramoyl-L-alanine amidase family protein [Defluviitaleaceae bacterium]|nr:N-acetylmuramoyl-L-alanine amidase family protein [Defluviitaleaceae bacterium]
MKFVKKLSVCVIFFSLLFIFAQNYTVHAQERVSITLNTANGSFLYENRSVTLNLNGQVLPEADMPPIILGDRTFVPVRHVFEAMGAVVDFHPEYQRILIAYHDSLIVMQIGQYHFNFDDTVLYMDVAPQIINDRTMAPVSFVAAAMGYGVEWNHDTATVYITTTEEQSYYEDIYYTRETDESDFAAMPLYNDTIDFIALSTDLTPGPIAIEANAPTQVNSITWNESRTQFTITATSRISSVDWAMLEGGRLFVDIGNATADFAQSSFNINNGFISTIRTGQPVNNGVSAARVVFDLTAPVAYYITISEDRTQVIVTFEQNTVTDISFLSTFYTHGRESIVITGSTAPATDVFLLHNPLRLVVDIPNAVLGFNGTLNGTGHFVQDLRFSQFEENTVRVVADLTRHPSFAVQMVDNTVTIHIMPPTFRNIYYNAETGVIEIVKPEAGLSIHQILEFERYVDLQHLFVLPGDFSTHFGYGDFEVRDRSLRMVEIVTENGVTSFTFNTTQIMAFDITEDAERIFIRPIHPRERYAFIVMIDPGHGGRYPGAVHRGLRESDLALDTALMVMEMLAADGIVRAYMTRNADVTVANSRRAEMANQTADIFVSIHYNASARGTAQGTETLYTVPDIEAERGLSFNSGHLANIFQDNLVEALDSIDRGTRNRPLIIVLNQTRIPAILLEVGFMDHPEEALRIADPAHRRRAAEAIVQSIYEAMEVFGPRW